METKICSKCGVEHPATREYFYSDKRAEDGFYSCCKKCTHSTIMNWRKKNSEKWKKYHKKYRQTIRGHLVDVVSAIVQRCTNPNCESYKNYGARGICCLFDSAQLFSWSVKNNIDPRDKDIHRINNDGDYTLDNIEFLEHGLHLSFHASLRRQGL